ncbi:MAG: MazG nucleotide pyrophosphohydrolase domain-containing protein [Ardenticatenaceae bacterium]
MSITFTAYQGWFREYDEKRGLTTDTSLESLGHLVEEVGEIARHVLRLEGHKAMDATARSQEIEALALELSDAFVFLTKLANAYDIEWDETIRRGMEKAEARWDVKEGQQEAARRRQARSPS